MSITGLRLTGLQQFTHTNGYRYVVMLYKAIASGKLASSQEGDVCWMSLTELLSRKAEMCTWFEQILQVYLEEELTEYALVQDRDDPEKWAEYLK